MKILHIIPSLKTGGAERLTLDICRELKRQGHEIALVTFYDVNEYKYLSCEINPQFLFVHIRPSLFRKWEINIEPLNRFIEKFKPDIIHSHLFESEILSRENIFPEAKYFTHCHDNMPQFKNLSFTTIFEKKQLTDFYEKQHVLKKYLQCDNKFIAISNDTKEYLEKTLPEKLRKNIFLLNNAINFKRFNAVNHQRELTQVRMISIGSFVAKKNQQFLLDVVNELIRRRVDVKLIMLGDGPMLKSIKQKISDYGLRDFVDCKGNAENVEQHLSEANLYVHSATYEPFGLVLLEAMAAGLPVISLDGKGNRDIMKDGVNGFLLAKPDAKLFAEKITGLLENKTAYADMSNSAISTAKEFDINEYVTKLLKLYQQ